MRTIGLIGGMSYYSSAVYYRLINEEVERRLGPHRSARLVLFSVDFGEILRCQEDKNWRRLEQHLAAAAESLAKAGAEAVFICSNTMHKFADAMATAAQRPVMHIADCVAAAIRAAGHRSTALLGTRFTMEQAFYRERLEASGLEVLIPSLSDRQTIQRVIYDELVTGRIEASSRQAFCEILDRLAAEGAQSAILGCTEIGLLIGQSDTKLALFDSTEVHARAAVDWALAPG